MSKILRHYPLISGAFYGFGTPAICVGLTYLFGNICWPQRLGAIYVGLAVLIQGLMAADEDRFSRTLADGTNLRGHINGLCFFAAVFGTIFAAFGDLLPAGFFYGVPMCGR
jgi:hypothetical protein